MLFENVSQYQKAKQTLLDNNRNIDKTANILKNSPLFYNLSEGEIICNLTELNEGLGDTITNFLSGAFGGDISKLKTVLTQMKEQELKFNREEYEIWDEFYRLLEDQKALEKDKKNPNYHSLSREIQQSRNALNLRLKELTKTHYEIFNGLEQRVKDLTKDSNRKKKYFNAQRANDVLETRNDRYEKIKSITARSSSRSQDLEDFFNVNVSDIEKERDEAQKSARDQEEKLRRSSVSSDDNPHETTKNYSSSVQEIEQEFDQIKKSPGGYYAKREDLKDLQKEIFHIIKKDDKKATNEKPYGDLGQESRDKLIRITSEITQTIRQIEKAHNDEVKGEEVASAAEKVISRKK